MPSLNTWMTGLNNARTLNELCLPASHDAGVYKDKDNGVKPGPSTQCQFSTIFNQALCGSRVFDIRCFLRTTGIINKTKTPTMGHFFKEGKDGYFGDYGGTLMAALDDAATFLKVYPSEFIIFRIGHTKCTGSVADALQQLEATKDSGNQPKFANIIFKGANVNLVNLTVQQLRGKLLLVFDKDFHDPTTFKTSNGYYPYTKWPKVPNIGLCFCGKYSGALKTALALKAEKKGNWSPDGAVELATAACEDHKKNHNNDHLLWVYWQETGGNVLENLKDPQGMHARLDKFVGEFRNPSTTLARPNIVGHDFVTDITCRKIIKLNPDVDLQF